MPIMVMISVFVYLIFEPRFQHFKDKPTGLVPSPNPRLLYRLNFVKKNQDHPNKSDPKNYFIYFFKFESTYETGMDSNFQLKTNQEFFWAWHQPELHNRKNAQVYFDPYHYYLTIIYLKPFKIVFQQCKQNIFNIVVV